MGTIYSASDIIGKTLIAKTKVNIYRNPTDNSELLGYVNAGQPVGVVYSYLEPSAIQNRSGFYWAFNQNGIYYYSKQDPGLYDVSALKQQGVLTTSEKVAAELEAAKQAALPWYENLIRKYGIWVVITIIAATAIKKKL